MNWTPDQDRELHALRATNPDDTDAQLALKFTAIAGFPATEDMVRNRLRRIDRQAEVFSIAPPTNSAKVVGAAAPDTFVGLRQCYWDLETTGLKAFQENLLVSSVGDEWGNIQTRTLFDFPQASIIDDRGLAEWTRDELKKYDIAVGWNSVLFDVPMLQGRLEWNGSDLLPDMMHIDPMYKARGGRYGMRVGGASLKNVSHFYRTPNTKPELEWSIWKRVSAGDKEAMEILIDRNRADVLVLRDIFEHMRKFVRVVHK